MLGVGDRTGADVGGATGAAVGVAAGRLDGLKTGGTVVPLDRLLADGAGGRLDGPAGGAGGRFDGPLTADREGFPS